MCAARVMTGPFLVRVITSSVVGVGGNVGRLTALSTLGSFAGTLGIGYVMIPLLPNSSTMFVTSAVLMLVCAGYFIAFRRRAAGPLTVMLLVGAATGAVWLLQPAHQFNWTVEKFCGNSHFGQLQVLDARERSCRF
jgi:hypothetical protein